MPRSACSATTRLRSESMCVEPQFSLMLMPSGVAWMRTTSAPWASSAAGAATYAAPFAQSTTTLRPSRLTGRPRLLTRWEM